MFSVVRKQITTNKTQEYPLNGVCFCLDIIKVETLLFL